MNHQLTEGIRRFCGKPCGELDFGSHRECAEAARDVPVSVECCDCGVEFEAKNAWAPPFCEPCLVAQHDRIADEERRYQQRRGEILSTALGIDAVDGEIP